MMDIDKTVSLLGELSRTGNAGPRFYSPGCGAGHSAIHMKLEQSRQTMTTRLTAGKYYT